MKKQFLTIIILIFGLGLFAAPVSIKSAQIVAVNFYKHYVFNKTNYSVADIITRKKNGVATFYIFIFNAGGYIMVAADDAVIPILGFSSDESFDKNNIPPNAEAWYEEQYSEQIKYIIDSNLDNSQTLQEWNKIRNDEFPTGKFAVNPLCTTEWDQNCYYNALCPADANGPCGHVYAGCVATSMAQIMKKWNYPTTGTNSHSYNTPYGTLTANFGATTYNWSAMPIGISSSNNNIATLIYQCGVAVDMTYGATSSSAYSSKVPTALHSFFGYKSTAQLVYKSSYSQNNWINLLKTELNASRPMYYAGYNGSAGHAFVCDGYNTSDQFHFNWGWSGYSDGYYAIGYLNPGSYTYNIDNEAVIGIEPATSTNAPVANFTANSTSITVGGSVSFSDLSTNNPTSWSWSFPGGTPSSSTQQNPQNITYSAAGTYNVTLTATNSSGSNTKTSQQYITVSSNLPVTPVWIKQNSGFTTSNRGINQIFIVDPNIVWATAFDGSNPTNYIREFTKTTNGGTTWWPGTITFTNSTNYGVSNIFAVSDMICYACMFPVSGTGGKIVKTTNGGISWTEQTTANFTGSWANFVHFFNTNNGVAVGDPTASGGDFVIYTTSNGGSTWTQVAGINIPNCSGSEAGVSNYYDAIGNTIWFGTSIGRIYKSTDKGLTWTVTQTNVGNDLAYPVFKDANTGFIVLHTSPYTIKKTTDGGSTWTSITPTGYFVKRPSLDFIPGTPAMWVDVSSGPAKGSSYSINDCASFLNIDTGSVQYSCVKFYDINTGWAGGFNSSAFDGGIYKWNPASIVGINEYEVIENSENITVYPNPANNYINIEFSKFSKEKIVVNVYNLLGRKLLSKEFFTPNGILELNMSEYIEGFYFLTVDTENRTIIKNFSIIR